MRFPIIVAVLCLLAPGAAMAQSHNHGQHHGATKPVHNKMPAEIDTTRSKASDRGHYTMSLAPQAEPVAINKMHSWVLEVRTGDGTPVENGDISVDGGMPAHGHGLPTSPRVTKYLGDGRYLVEGVRFNMGGWWELKFAVAGHHADTATFNIMIE